MVQKLNLILTEKFQINPFIPINSPYKKEIFQRNSLHQPTLTISMMLQNSLS